MNFVDLVEGAQKGGERLGFDFVQVSTLTANDDDVLIPELLYLACCCIFAGGGHKVGGKSKL